MFWICDYSDNQGPEKRRVTVHQDKQCYLPVLERSILPQHTCLFILFCRGARENNTGGHASHVNVYQGKDVTR